MMKDFPTQFRAAAVGSAAALIGAMVLSISGVSAQDGKFTPTPFPWPTALMVSVEADKGLAPIPSPTLPPTLSLATPTPNSSQAAATLSPDLALETIVADLIAQTQQASAQAGTTQTVQAALNAALTATADAPLQSTATLQSAQPTQAPFSSADLEVVDVIETELRAEPGNTAAYLSPDGQRFLYLEGMDMCIYTSDAEQERCIEIPDELRLDYEAPYWSADSRYVTFTNEFFRTFRDPDIWVLDSTDMSLTNLTDDGTLNVEIFEDDWGNVDVAPRWLPDNRIVFLRYSQVGGVDMPPQIFSIGLDGGEPELLGEVQTSDPLPVFVIDVFEDGTTIAYNHFSPNDTERNGAWVSAIDGSEARQVLTTDRPTAPMTVDFSPDGRYLLTISGMLLGLYDQSQPAQAIRVIDLETGTVTILDEDVYIRSAGWSPTGSTLAYLVTDQVNPENAGLYIADVPTEAGRQVLEGNYIVPTPRQQQTIQWAENNTILLSVPPEFALRVVELG